MGAFISVSQGHRAFSAEADAIRNGSTSDSSLVDFPVPRWPCTRS